MNGRKLGFWALFLALQVLTVVLLSELSLRLLRRHSDVLRVLLYHSNVQRAYDNEHTVHDLLESTLFGFKPGKHHGGFYLNSKGLRTPEYAMRRAKETYRVVALGDSFTFASSGVPWEQHYPVRFGRLLAESWGRPVEVINLAAPGVGPQFYLRMWQVEGVRLDADLVLVGLFVGNDFTEEQAPVVRTGMSESLAQVSYLARLIRNIDRLRSTEILNPPTPHDAAVGPRGTPEEKWLRTYSPFRRTLSDQAFLRIEANRSRICHRSGAEAFARQMIPVQDSLEQLRTEVQASGAELIVLVIPDKFQVDPALLSRIAESKGGDAGDYDVDRPQRALRTYFTEAGFKYVDVLPAMQAANQDRTKPMYKANDTHWSNYGTMLAADHLLTYVQSNRFDDSRLGR